MKKAVAVQRCLCGRLQREEGKLRHIVRHDFCIRLTCKGPPIRLSHLYVVVRAVGEMASSGWALQDTKMVPILLDVAALGTAPWSRLSFSEKVAGDKNRLSGTHGILDWEVLGKGPSSKAQVYAAP